MNHISSIGRASVFAGLCGVAAVLTLQFTSSAAAGIPCVGDCDGDCRVTVGEIMGAVCISVLNAPFCRECAAMDSNGDGQITINELIQAVNNALSGCRSPCCPIAKEASPTPSPTMPPTSTATQTATDTATHSATPEPPDPLQDAVVAALDGDMRCSQLWVWASSAIITIDCDYGPGHDSMLSFNRLANEADAAESVAEYDERGGAIDFAGTPAYLWEAQFPTGGLEFNYRYLRAQFGCWFISAESFDDTLYRLAFHPVELTEAVVSAVSGELLARCD